MCSAKSLFFTASFTVSALCFAAEKSPSNLLVPEIRIEEVSIESVTVRGTQSTVASDPNFMDDFLLKRLLTSIENLFRTMTIFIYSVGEEPTKEYKKQLKELQVVVEAAQAQLAKVSAYEEGILADSTIRDTKIFMLRAQLEITERIVKRQLTRLEAAERAKCIPTFIVEETDV